MTWIPGQVHLASYIEKVEIKQLYNPETDDYDIDIDLSTVKNQGLLMITKPLSGTESLDAVNFAHELDKNGRGKNTGEAITGAIAKSRNWTIVTDDVQATTFLTKQGLGPSLITTLEVIECWTRSTNLSVTDIKQVLQCILSYARYGPPPKEHPLHSWWLSFKIKI